MTRLVVAQLTSGSPPGLLRPWAVSRGIELEVVRPDLGEPLPAVRSADGLVVLGSDASVRDDWLPGLAAARRWTAEALAVDVPVLGIGLGAQLMAAVLGAVVVREPEPQVGLVRIATADPGVPAGPWVTYTEDAILAPRPLRSGPHLGVEFHAQATPEMVRAWRREGRFPVPADLDERMVDQIMSIASNARALFSGWATYAGIDAGTEPLPVVTAT